MADEAHNEPTMEEILSSIRKIISEDEVPAETLEASSSDETGVVVEGAVNDDFEDLVINDIEDDAEVSFDDAFEEEDIFEVETSVEDDAFEPEPTMVQPLEVTVEDEFELEIEAEAEPEVTAFSPEPTTIQTKPEPQIDSAEEPEMSATAQIDRSVLTDASTADAAAGAMGQLFSKMDLSGDNTIEGLVRELLKPMIKEWLDANLQGIVESKVEAEVARIARMAR